MFTTAGQQRYVRLTMQHKSGQKDDAAFSGPALAQGLLLAAAIAPEVCFCRFHFQCKPLLPLCLFHLLSALVV